MRNSNKIALMKCIVMPRRIILLLIGNHYYCLYGTILLGTISPILLPNLEPSYWPMKNGMERYSLFFNCSEQIQAAAACIYRIPVKSYLIDQMR